MTKHIEAVIFDWAGTVVDYGCFAPMHAFIRTFEQAGIPVTEGEAREPMGMLKRDHIQAMLNMDRIKTAWGGKFGQQPGVSDVGRLYTAFESMLMETLDHFTDPIPGVLEIIEQLRHNGMKIGSTTGYTSAMMEVVASGAKRKGYEPDYMVCSDEVKAGRPSPYMIYRNLYELEVYPPKCVVKVGDTVADVLEGKNAGVWSVAVMRGSSELGLSQSEVESMVEAELHERLNELHRKFEDAGADYVIESMDQLPAVIKTIDSQL